MSEVWRVPADDGSGMMEIRPVTVTPPIGAPPSPQDMLAAEADMSDIVITFEDGDSGCQFILGEDGQLGVGAHWDNEGHMSYISAQDAVTVAEAIMAWAFRPRAVAVEGTP